VYPLLVIAVLLLALRVAHNLSPAIGVLGEGLGVGPVALGLRLGVGLDVECLGPERQLCT